MRYKARQTDRNRTFSPLDERPCLREEQKEPYVWANLESFDGGNRKAYYMGQVRFDEVLRNKKHYPCVQFFPRRSF